MGNGEDLLNGSAAEPLYGGVTAVASSPNEVGASTTRTSANPQQVLFAWVGLAALLILANVVTLEVQR